MPKRLWLALTGVLALTCAAFMGLAWLQDSHVDPGHCAGCHATTSYHTSQAARVYLFHRHAECAVHCESCHSRSLRDALTQLVSDFHDTYELPTAVEPPPAENCMRCHQDDSEAAEKENPHDAHFGGIECSICHTMLKPIEMRCSRCHAAELVAGWGTIAGQ